MDEMNALERQLADVVRGAMRPPRPVDAAAIVRTATTASSPGRWSVVTRLRGRTSQAPTTRGFTMYSALKFLAASVILALFGGVLLMGLLSTSNKDEIAPATEVASLVPSGMQILTPSTGATTALVADGDGVLWALEQPGRLVRFDADANETTEWTLADDIAFGQARSIAPSAEGGVWLAGPDAARHFDGDRFAQVIEAPEALKLAAEGADGSLLAATETGAALYWTGSDWEDIGPTNLVGCDWIGALEVDSVGRPWVGGWRYPVCEGRTGARLMVLDGSEWTRFGQDDVSPLGQAPQSIVEMPDGSIWVASGGGLARFDGTAWTDESPKQRGWYGSLAASPGGAIWASSGEGSARVLRSDGSDWVTTAGTEGLPDEHWLAGLAVIDDRVFLGTSGGTYEWTGDRWDPVWDAAPSRPGSPRLLATGHDELWVVDAQGVRHAKDGTWIDELEWTTQVADPSPDVFLRDFAIGPDDTVWVAGPDGVAYRDGQRWELIDERKAGAIAVDATGTVWVARSAGAAGCRLWTLRKDDGVWVRENIDGCPLEWAADLSLAVDGAGAVWIGNTGSWLPGGLVRYTKGKWKVIDEVGDAKAFGAVVLGTDHDGAVWVVSQLNLGSENSITVARGPMARFHDGDVSIVELPEASGFDEQILLGGGVPWTALAADGTPWTMFDRGPARFDGRAWRFPYVDAGVPRMKVGAVASDGSVYGVTYGGLEGGDIVRFPAAGEMND